MTAVAAERDAVVGDLRPRLELRLGPYPAIDTGAATVLAAGIGPAAAAAAAAAALALGRYDGVLSVGIGGGFAGRAVPGDLVVADSVVAADLGADSPDGFLTADELGWRTGTLPVPPELVEGLAARLRTTGRPVVTGPVLTVSTITGTADRAAALAGRWRPAAEAMEGYGVLLAASAAGVPAAEIRAVSNPVGPRDRASWEMPRALAALADAAGVLLAGDDPSFPPGKVPRP